MGTLHREFWISEGMGRTRRERQSGAYFYYLPGMLKNMGVALEPDVVGDVGRAEQAIAALNERVRALRSSEGIARLLLRAEAVSSSYIEGLSIGTRRLLKAEMNLGDRTAFRHDESAAEVVGNIHAMQDALAAAEADETITVDTILAIHRALCAGTRIDRYGGKLRDRQNWVGGNSYNPLSADYVPPAPQHVEGLLDDLAQYCNDRVVSPIVQAALVHAQFESIHPFVDGNGRTGRALIHLVLRRRGLAPRLVPPVSLVLATHSESYVQGLTGFRYTDSEGEVAVRDGINEWVSFFAGACLASCEEAERFEQSADVLQAAWRERLGAVRKNSALDLLLEELVGMPVFTVKSAVASIGRATSATTAAIERCAESGIVKPIGSQKRNRTFEVPEVINEFNIFERRLASPVGDTSAAKPVRAVPENLRRGR
ncbi:Fic family protein [Arabiibacter massiliensis]|uniref:Fic family protein n=1 Tax=Arabiibacter massiliensis TaxID=1870985 RepID=UPI00155B37F3|nr:Fic family protein [Arabiibacter massiliensis]